MNESNVKKIAVLIPARGGSKGLARKNVLQFNGHPLISWSIKNAIDTKCVSGVFVSTDCEEISSISEHYGATVVKRPPAISTDTSSTEEVIQHFFDVVPTPEIEHLCLLQCTSPIRRTSFIDDFFSAHIHQRVDSSLSVASSHRFLWKVDETKKANSINYDPSRRPRRQDIKTEEIIYEETGSGYIFSKKGFLESQSRLFGKIGIFETAWAESFEIDTKQDFLVLEHMHKLYITGQLDD